MPSAEVQAPDRVVNARGRCNCALDCTGHNWPPCQLSCQLDQLPTGSHHQRRLVGALKDPDEGFFERGNILASSSTPPDRDSVRNDDFGSVSTEPRKSGSLPSLLLCGLDGYAAPQVPNDWVAEMDPQSLVRQEISPGWRIRRDHPEEASPHVTASIEATRQRP